MDLFKAEVLIKLLDVLKDLFGKFGSARNLSFLMLLVFLKSAANDLAAQGLATAAWVLLVIFLQIRSHSSS